MKAEVGFTGQNGATVATRPPVHVAGCGPAFTASLRRAAARQPVLRVKLLRHPDGGRLARFSVTLPKQLRLNRARAKREVSAIASEKLARSAVKVKGLRTVTVSGLAKKALSRISLRLDRGR